jgi:DNA repair protein RadD
MSKFLLPSFGPDDRFTPFAHQNDLIDTIVAGARRGENTLVESPTGSGKAVALAETGGVIHDMTGLPVLITVPNSDLARQNAAACARQRSDLKTSVYCAKIGARDLSGDLVIATPNSLVRQAALPKFGAILVDEAHLLPPHDDSMLQSVIKRAREKNPEILVHGASATCFRMDGSLLTSGGIWDQVAMRVDYLPLMKAGLLAPLVGPVGAKLFKLDVSGLKRTAGDFNEKQMNQRFNTADVTVAMARDIVKLGTDRSSWLVFCVSVAAADRMTRTLRDMGVDAHCISFKTPPDERADLLERYRRREIKALVSMAILTVGFDGPGTDLLALCRPTQSINLNIQILGRGSRVAPGKKDCLVLDFAGNITRCGAINAPNLYGIGDKSASKPAPKQCEECGHYEPPHARECSNCGTSLIKVAPPPKKAPALSTIADRDVQPIADRAFIQQQIDQQPNTFRVTGWNFSVHHKTGQEPSLKIEYLVAGYRYRSVWCWITAWHKGGAAWHGQKSWAQLLKDGAPRKLPENAQDACAVAHTYLQKPEFVRVVMEGGFPNVTPINISRAA